MHQRLSFAVLLLHWVVVFGRNSTKFVTGAWLRVYWIHFEHALVPRHPFLPDLFCRGGELFVPCPFVAGQIVPERWGFHNRSIHPRHNRRPRCPRDCCIAHCHPKLPVLGTNESRRNRWRVVGNEFLGFVQSQPTSKSLLFWKWWLPWPINFRVWCHDEKNHVDANGARRTAVRRPTSTLRGLWMVFFRFFGPWSIDANPWDNIQRQKTIRCVRESIEKVWHNFCGREVWTTHGTLEVLNNLPIDCIGVWCVWSRQFFVGRGGRRWWRRWWWLHWCLWYKPTKRHQRHHHQGVVQIHIFLSGSRVVLNRRKTVGFWWVWRRTWYICFASAPKEVNTNTK